MYVLVGRHVSMSRAALVVNGKLAGTAGLEPASAALTVPGSAIELDAKNCGDPLASPSPVGSRRSRTRLNALPEQNLELGWFD